MADDTQSNESKDTPADEVTASESARSGTRRDSDPGATATPQAPEQPAATAAEPPRDTPGGGTAEAGDETVPGGRLEADAGRDDTELDDDATTTETNDADDDDDDTDGDDAAEDGDGVPDERASRTRDGADAVPARHLSPEAPLGHGEALAHVVSLPVLLSVFGALVVLTIVTVGVTTFDLGPTGNLVVAMVIATVKAVLVVAVFMHLLFDRSFHLLLFLTSVLFVILFISLSMMDRVEYQPSIDQLEAAKAAAAAAGAK